MIGAGVSVGVGVEAGVEESASMGWDECMGKIKADAAEPSTIARATTNSTFFVILVP